MATQHDTKICIQLKNIPRFSFCFIFILTSLNALYNSLSVEFLQNYPYTTFLFNPFDIFADYFKLIFSYPSSLNVSIPVESRIDKLLLYFQHSHAYADLAGSASGHITHFHVTPLTTIFNLSNLYLMIQSTPLTIFTIMILGFFCFGIFIISNINYTNKNKLYFIAIFFLCYPTLFLVTRGNIVSGVASLCIIYFLTSIYKENVRWLSIVSIALAINIRPNAIIFLLAFIILDNKKIKYLLNSVVCTSFMFFSSLYFANYLYKDYNLTNFILGIKNYYNIYVIYNEGIAFGSSLLGGLKLLYGPNAYFEFFIIILGILILISVLTEYKFGLANKIMVIYILCSIYCLCSSVFADYHLLVFIAPIICMCPHKNNGFKCTPHTQIIDLVILFPCLLALSPKNYIFVKNISLQVVMNPIIILASVLALLLSPLTYKFLKKSIKFPSYTAI